MSFMAYDKHIWKINCKYKWDFFFKGNILSYPCVQKIYCSSCVQDLLYIYILIRDKYKLSIVPSILSPLSPALVSILVFYNEIFEHTICSSAI